MTFSITFIERLEGESPSIERVFRRIATELERFGVRVGFQKVPYGNGFFDLVRNLLFFDPQDADIFHITGHVNYLALRLDKRKTVLTLHDATILSLRKGLRRWAIRLLYFTLPIRRLRYITAISNFTQREMAEIGWVSEAKIELIENPLLVEPTGEVVSFCSENPRILQIGTSPNKNVRNLVRAVTGMNVGLTIVGKLSDELKGEIDGSRIPYSNVVGVGDNEIREAYQASDIVSFCSTNEGFGLPIIEAQAFGKPVITSNRSPMKEVAGSGAILVDPEAPEEIAAAIRNIIENEDLRKRLVCEGSKNIERFDPKRIAAQYLELYTRMLKGVDETPKETK